MAPQNLPVLYENIMFGLPSDHACRVFLWAVERPGEDRMCYRAERFARESHDLMQTIPRFISLAMRAWPKADPIGSKADDLMTFILTRHANWRFGGNVRLPESLFAKGGA